MSENFTLVGWESSIIVIFFSNSVMILFSWNIFWVRRGPDQSFCPWIPGITLKITSRTLQPACERCSPESVIGPVIIPSLFSFNMDSRPVPIWTRQSFGPVRSSWTVQPWSLSSIVPYNRNFDFNSVWTIHSLFFNMETSLIGVQGRNDQICWKWTVHSMKVRWGPSWTVCFQYGPST